MGAMTVPSLSKPSICEQTGNLRLSTHARKDSALNNMASSLDSLNLHQRQAVEHGVIEGRATMASPLLIIAGAGSGKTNTLAHRVAHLIAHGADPHRILLMTFSRRAAAEMSHRVQRICKRTLGDGAGHHLLPWAGTFHGIGARLLRDHAEQIGLNPDFTIHDARDSEDLMNLVRHELGFSKTHDRFPKKGTCLSIYSRVINTEATIDEVVKRFFPRCAGLEGDLKISLQPMWRPSRPRTSSITTISCSTGRRP